MTFEQWLQTQDIADLQFTEREKTIAHLAWKMATIVAIDKQMAEIARRMAA